MATDAYFNREAQTRLAKIRERLADGSERIVHRMGDLGYLDGLGRLWFCGRKSQRVVLATGSTLCTEQIEPVFNTHPAVTRTALVAVPVAASQGVLELSQGDAGQLRQEADTAAGMAACLCVELRPGVDAGQWPEIRDALQTLANGRVHTAKVTHFLHYPGSFPVDIRHNAKIGREKLAQWAARQLAQAKDAAKA